MGCIGLVWFISFFWADEIVSDVNRTGWGLLCRTDAMDKLEIRNGI